MEISKNLAQYVKMHSENINNGEWDKLFGKDIYDVTPLMFSEIDKLYEMITSIGVNIDLIELSKKYKTPDTYLRDPNEQLDSFVDRVEKEFYDKFYTTKFASLFKKITFEEIFQGMTMVSTLIDSDFSGSNFDDTPTFIELFLILSDIGYPTFRINFTNEDTGEQLSGYFKMPGDNILYLPFGVFYDYKQVRDAQNDLIQELETEIIG